MHLSRAKLFREVQRRLQRSYRDSSEDTIRQLSSAQHCIYWSDGRKRFCGFRLTVLCAREARNRKGKTSLGGNLAQGQTSAEFHRLGFIHLN